MTEYGEGGETIEKIYPEHLVPFSPSSVGRTGKTGDLDKVGPLIRRAYGSGKRVPTRDELGRKALDVHAVAYRQQVLEDARRWFHHRETPFSLERTNNQLQALFLHEIKFGYKSIRVEEGSTQDDSGLTIPGGSYDATVPGYYLGETFIRSDEKKGLPSLELRKFLAEYVINEGKVEQFSTLYRKALHTEPRYTGDIIPGWYDEEIQPTHEERLELARKQSEIDDKEEKLIGPLDKTVNLVKAYIHDLDDETVRDEILAVPKQYGELLTSLTGLEAEAGKLTDTEKLKYDIDMLKGMLAKVTPAQHPYMAAALDSIHARLSRVESAVSIPEKLATWKAMDKEVGMVGMGKHEEMSPILRAYCVARSKNPKGYFDPVYDLFQKNLRPGETLGERWNMIQETLVARIREEFTAQHIDFPITFEDIEGYLEGWYASLKLTKQFQKDVTNKDLVQDPLTGKNSLDSRGYMQFRFPNYDDSKDEHIPEHDASRLDPIKRDSDGHLYTHRFIVSTGSGDLEIGGLEYMDRYSHFNYYNQDDLYIRFPPGYPYTVAGQLPSAVSIIDTGAIKGEHPSLFIDGRQGIVVADDDLRHIEQAREIEKKVNASKKDLSRENVSQQFLGIPSADKTGIVSTGGDSMSVVDNAEVLQRLEITPVLDTQLSQAAEGLRENKLSTGSENDPDLIAFTRLDSLSDAEIKDILHRLRAERQDEGTQNRLMAVCLKRGILESVFEENMPKKVIRQRLSNIYNVYYRLSSRIPFSNEKQRMYNEASLGKVRSLQTIYDASDGQIIIKEMMQLLGKEKIREAIATFDEENKQATLRSQALDYLISFYKEHAMFPQEDMFAERVEEDALALI